MALLACSITMGAIQRESGLRMIKGDHLCPGVFRMARDASQHARVLRGGLLGGNLVLKPALKLAMMRILVASRAALIAKLKDRWRGRLSHRAFVALATGHCRVCAPQRKFRCLMHRHCESGGMESRHRMTIIAAAGTRLGVKLSGVYVGMAIFAYSVGQAILHDALAPRVALLAT
jgi:hypothetical protein